jgi:hypothetical protein
MVFLLKPIEKNPSEKLGELRLYAETISSFSVTSPPTRVGAGHVLNEVKELGWGLI